MAAFTAESINILNGQDVAEITSQEAINTIRKGDFLVIGSFPPVEILQAYKNGQGERFIELLKPWPHTSQSNQPAIVIPTTVDYREAVEALRAANTLVSDNKKAMVDWQTNMGTVTFKDKDGNDVVVKTLKQIESDADSATTAAINAVETRAQQMYREALEAASGGKNTVKYDAQGNPNVMVWINKFNCEDINQAILERHGVDCQLGVGVFPAFIQDGVQMRGFWYAKYVACADESGGCSVVARAQPNTSVDYDTAKSLCINKGPGWHLSSNWEWMAIAYLSLAYGNQPRGDTNYGRAHDAKYEVATRASAMHAPGDTAHSYPSLTGTGPSTWSHDGTQFGIFDMVGNVWEWQDQLKQMDGQIMHTVDNNPNLSESNWPAHECYLDSVGVTSGSIILNNMIENRLGTLGDSQNVGNSNSNTWRTTPKSEGYIDSELMRRIGIEPAPGATLSGSIYSRNYGERLPFRGGAWNNTSNAGLGALFFFYSRPSVLSTLGFRPALFES